MTPRVLVTGSAGQVGSELVPFLRSLYGSDRVVAADIRRPPGSGDRGEFEQLDVTDSSAIDRVMAGRGIEVVYHLAGVLSARGEEAPQLAWRVNVDGLRNMLEAAVRHRLARVFWPSSIAVFGPDAPREQTPQGCPLNPTTIYGVGKVAGELLCNYYFTKYGLDVRCLRYPGLVSNMAPPGGGTTDYAVDIFHAALSKGRYTCFLREGTVLPMMYMPDALRATVELMEAEQRSVPRHMGYNLAAVSFSAGEIASEIRKHIPSFAVTYAPDERQTIADSWPKSVSDEEARRDWGWSHRYDLAAMTSDMLAKLGARHLRAEKDV